MENKKSGMILIAIMLFALSAAAFGENIDPDNDGSQYCYGENIGWINLQPSQGPGITVTDSAVSGMAWGENIGWINFSHAQGGITNDGSGTLSGKAWGENIGWINLGHNQTGSRVKIDPQTGVFSGYGWGENIGWINFAGVKTSWRGAPATHIVTPSAGANGSISPNTPLTVNHGETAVFTVAPNSGFMASVGGTCGGVLSDNTFTTSNILADCSVEAEFIDALGPVITFLGVSPNPVPINTPVILSAVLDDSLTGNSPIMQAEYLVDGGSYTTMTPQDGTFDVAVEGVSATLPGFAVPGVYEICVRGADLLDNATAADECLLLPVYDPSGGFVTGGGWFESPAEAYAPDVLLSGKATFGFVSKYQKGANVPTGVTEFQFKVADLNFHSDTYGWLVVAGAKAQYKGTGTINGQGSYNFMISAIDADINKTDAFIVDRFRIKIWSEDNGGNETVIYDNALGSDSDTALTEISGGSIVIHTAKK
jgi:hypothetical protein